ncbi:HxlR-like helix-turn-helix [uncultured archaeon]|nr:HxlR-like helix-turn-helix [uncultured archaeon]
MPEEKEFDRVYAFCAKKHNLPVLKVLLGHPHGAGFNAILKAAKPITPRILSTRLKELEKLKLVTKGMIFGTPPKIEYRVTAKAEGLKKIFTDLEEWGKKELE